MTLREWLTGLTPDARVAALERDKALLLARVEVLELQNEWLGDLNENLRRWLRANTALAVQVGDSLGVPQQLPQMTVGQNGVQRR